MWPQLLQYAAKGSYILQVDATAHMLVSCKQPQEASQH